MKTAIIIIQYGDLNDTLRCLRSLEALTDAKNVTVYLVDNGTKEVTTKLLRKFSLNIKPIISDRNRGFTGGNNLGLTEALKHRHDYFLLLNNDTTVQPDLLETLRKPFKDGRVGVTGCIITYDQSNRVWFAGGIVNTSLCLTKHISMGKTLKTERKVKYKAVDFITGATFLIKREVLEKIGLLFEDYFIYWEDVEFCYRSRKAGYECILVNQPLVAHSVSASTGKKGTNKLSPMRAYFYARNPFLFMKRNDLTSATGIFGQLCIRLPYSLFTLTSVSAFINYMRGLRDGLIYLRKIPIKSDASSK
jgi:GT2 family glycosyltransferase